MIRVSMTEKGSVALRTNSRLDRSHLRKLKYLLDGGGGRLVTYWTYLKDLRRDLKGRRVRWAPSIAPRLRSLIDSCKSDPSDELVQEVSKVFDDGLVPYRFQFDGIDKALKTKKILIADATGLGKTIQTLGTLFVAQARGEVRRAIIVCSASLKSQWYAEAEKFSRHPLKGWLVANGTKAQRRKLYKRPWKVLVINPRLLVNDQDQLARYAAEIDFAAIDEASCIKNPDTAISICAKSLLRKPKYKIALTATPIENGLIDLFSILDWVDKRVLISRSHFMKSYVVWKTISFSPPGRSFRVRKKVPVRYRRLDEVASKIRPVYIRRSVSEVKLQLPRLVIIEDKVVLGKRQMDVYKAIKSKMADQIKGIRGAALEPHIISLQQAANSTGLVIKGPGPHYHAKVDRLKELLDSDLLGEQVIVFTEFEKLISKILRHKLKSYGVSCYTGKMGHREREDHLESFKNGNKRILLMTSAGERGLNLQAASIVVNFDLPFNPARIKQRIGRVVRIGSKHECCRMINLIAASTVEESLIAEKIYKKSRVFEQIFGADELTSAETIDDWAEAIVGLE